MADAKKIKLGPCTLTFYHPTLGALDLGHSIGNTVFTYKPDIKKTQVAKYGSTTVKRWLVGEDVSLETKLAEWTLPNLRTAIAYATLQGDDSVSVGSKAGKDLTDNAGLLVAHPDSNAASNKDDDVGIYKALVTNDLKIEFDPNGERVIPVTFEGQYDESRADGDGLAFIGDSIG